MALQQCQQQQKQQQWQQQQKQQENNVDSSQINSFFRDSVDKYRVCFVTFKVIETKSEQEMLITF